MLDRLLSKSEKIENMVKASYLNDKAKRNYLQAYQTRLKKINYYTESTIGLFYE